MNRRSLTPPTGLKGIIAQRRGSGGARREISARVTLRAGDLEYDGWALNISRGGIRVVIEGHVVLGEEYEVMGYDPEDPDAPPRPGRVVWLQDERDGAVVGMEFLDVVAPSSAAPPMSPGAAPSSPPSPSPAAPSSPEGSTATPASTFTPPPPPPSEPPRKP